MNEERYRHAERRLWASLGVAPAERWVRLPHAGLTLRVQEIGDGPALVLVHGGSNSGSCWAPLVRRLDGFRCILPDRPGCGLSAPLTKPLADVGALGEFAEMFITDLLDGLGLDQAAVVANSFGGYIALRSAAAHPNRISRIVELGWPVGAPIGRTPISMRLVNVPLIGRLLASLPPNKRIVRAILRDAGLRRALEEDRISEEALDWFLSLLRDTDTMINELRFGPRVISPLHGMNEDILLPPGLLSRIQTPAYFLWGEEDLFGGAEIARSFVSRLPNAELELLPGAGHAVWMDAPDDVAKAITGFLTRSSAGTWRASSMPVERSLRKE